MVSDNLYLKRICAGRKGIGGIYAILAVFLLLSGAVAYFLNTAPSSPVVQDNNIRKLSSYGELETYLKSSGGGGIYGGPQGVMRAEMETADTSKAVSSVPGGSQDYSQTNIQVEGVDEADIVKNDGKYIYAVSGSRISIVDAYPAETAKIISAIDFNGTVNEIFVNGNTLVAFGQKYETYSSGETDENTASSKMATYPRYSQKTAIMIYDISDRSNPSVSGDIRIDGNYYDSRMIGKYVYVIANQPTYYMAASKIPLPEITSGGRCIIGQCSSAGFPDVYYFDGSQGNVFTTIAAINLDNPADITGKIILTNYAQGMYVSEKNIYITYTKWLSETDYIERFVEVIKPLVPSDVQSKIDAVMFLDVSKQTKWQAVNEIMEKYVGKLSDEERKALEEKGKEKIDELQREIAREREKTIVQKISIDSGNINYVTNGEVPGNALNQFSMDEYKGYFRIATTTSGNGGMTPVLMATSVQGRAIQQEAVVAENTGSSASTAVESQATPQKKTGLSSEEQQMIETRPTPAPQSSRIESQNNVYVLDRDLKIIGRLEGLAPGERIYSARFLGDKAYLVTFRQIDPLFVIDMSSPESPVVLGYLKIPGVSDYMHPYDETHVIGIGRDSTSDGRIKGMKISLFDVSDVANPAEISKYIIGGQGTYSEAIYDHKAILFSREKNLLVLPVSEYSQPETGSSPEKTWEYSYWQGAYVFGINLDSGITLKGKITHRNTEDSLSTMRTEGRFGSALKFSGANGAGNYVSYPRIFTGKHNEITFEAWINPSKYNNETAWIAGHRVHVGGAQLLINPGKAEWLVAGGSTDIHYAISSTSEIPLNTWTHVAGTFDGSALRLYVNGKEETNLNATFDVLWSGDYRGSFIGKDGSGWFSAFNGKIDDVRVYSRVLSPAEIASQYSGNEVSSVGLEGWWKFDETTGDTVVDSSGKGNDGTIIDYASRMSSYYDYTTQIRRSLYIDNVLYTISQKLVKMNSITDMTAINKVELPYEEHSYPVRY